MPNISRRDAMIAVGAAAVASPLTATKASAQTAGDPLIVKLHQFEASNGVARISSPELATALVQRPSEAQSLLKERTDDLMPSEIFIDSTGRVVIFNKEYADSIEQEIMEAQSNESAMAMELVKNGGCGLGC